MITMTIWISVEHVAHLLALEDKSNLAKKVIDVYMDSLQGDNDAAERYWVGEFRQQPLFIHFIRTLLKSSHSYWHEYPPRDYPSFLGIHVPDLTMDQQLRSRQRNEPAQILWISLPIEKSLHKTGRRSCTLVW